MKVSLFSKTIGGFAWVSSGKIVQAVLKIAVISILARLLTPEAFGVLATASLVISFSLVFLELGVAQALIQRSELHEKHTKTAATFSVFMGIAVGALIYWCAPLAEGFFSIEGLGNVIRVLAFSYIFSGFSLVPLALLQREMNFRALAAVDIVSYTLGYGVLAVSLAFLDFGVWALVSGALFQAFLRVLFLIYASRCRLVFGFSLSAIRELLMFGGGMTLSRVGGFVSKEGDTFIVAKMLGAEQLGFYSRAYSLMVMPVTLFGSVLTKVFFPALSRVQHRPEVLREAYLTAVAGVSSIALPISVILFLGSRDIVEVLFGSGWSQAGEIVRILSLGLLFRMGYKASDSLSTATGHIYKRAWRQWVFAILILSFCYIGSISMGAKGVAIGVVCALFLNYTLMAMLSLRIVNAGVFDFLKLHRSAAVVALVFAVVGWAGQSLGDTVWDNPFARIFGMLLFCIFSVILMLRFMNRTVLDQRLRKVVERFLKVDECGSQSPGLGREDIRQRLLKQARECAYWCLLGSFNKVEHPNNSTKMRTK